MRLCIFGLDEFSIDSPEDFIRLVLMSDLFFIDVFLTLGVGS